MVKSNKSKKNNTKQSKKSKTQRATFSGTGIDAPLALDMSRPVIGQKFRAPNHVGSEGRVTGVDFVGTVDSSNAAYSINTYNINARNSTLFPRLSEIAGVWRRYYPKMIKFHLFGINAATQRGYVAMSSLVTDDLATLVSPTTEVQVLNQENIAVGRPWSYTCHTVNLGGLGLKWYTTDTATSSSEFGEYIGRAFLGIPQTTNNADIQIQVYVEYDFEFCQRIAASLSESCEDVGGSFTKLTSFSLSDMLNGSSPDPSNNGISLSGGNIIFTKAGEYLISAYSEGTGLGFFSLTGGTELAQSGIGTSRLAIFRSTLSDGGSVGPLILASGSPITTLEVWVSRVPSGSTQYEKFSIMPRIRCVQK